MTIDDFYRRVVSEVEGYYCGNTSNGEYNDDSGIAYLVKYFEDGTVRTLYMGKFRNGLPEDSTGNAWMIGRLNTDEAYSYYKGPFSKGSASIDPESHSKNWELDITQDRIEELIAELDFPGEMNLKWSSPTT